VRGTGVAESKGEEEKAAGRAAAKGNDSTRERNMKGNDKGALVFATATRI
jgi:hypothetical protein